MPKGNQIGSTSDIAKKLKNVGIKKSLKTDVAAHFAKIALSDEHIVIALSGCILGTNSDWQAGNKVIKALFSGSCKNELLAEWKQVKSALEG